MRAMEWLGPATGTKVPTSSPSAGELYAAAIEQLLASGAAYACDCPPEAVAERARQRGDKTSSYDGYCRDRRLEPAAGAFVAVPDPRRRAKPALTTSFAARSPSTTPRSRTSGCASPTAIPSLSWPTSSTTPTCGSPTSSEARTTSPTPPSTCCCGRPSATASARLRPPAAALQRRPQEALQAPRQGGGRGLPGRGLPARGHAQLPGPAGLVARRQPGDPDPRRAGGRVSPGGRQERRRHLRRAQAAGRSTPNTCGRSRRPSWSNGPRPGCAAGGSRWPRKCRNGPARWRRSTP